MSWLEKHKISEDLAAKAHIAVRDGDVQHAEKLFAEAAIFEQEAIGELDTSKQRTLGVTVVSAASLWFKSKRYEEAEKISHQWLASNNLPAFASEQLRSILQASWAEVTKQNSQLQFVAGKVFFSIKGSQVAYGGAPLDLIVEKVQTVQSVLYRTVEFIKGVPHRAHGAPSQEITNSCRPWLFQEVPGSYQFSVAIQEPKQRSFFEDARIKPEIIVEKFFDIIKNGAEDPENGLSSIVSDIDYMKTFLNLTRNLAPNGKAFSQLEIRKSNNENPIVLRVENRQIIRNFLNAKKDAGSIDLVKSEFQPKYISGVLRGLHLDKDWLELISDDKSITIRGLADTVDDVIGPMINRQVTVRVIELKNGNLKFLDIELDE